MFLKNSRVVKENGILFEEEDVILTKHIFKNDINITTSVNFIDEAFGFVLIPFDEQKNDLSDSNFLFRITDNAVRLYYNTQVSNKLLKERSINIDTKEDIIINFLKVKNYIEIRINNNLVFEYDNSNSIKYRVGIYSTKGNTVRNIDIKTKTPLNWNTNMKNTKGGFIEYIKNGFILSNCINEAEIVQNSIDLKKGFNYLTFKESKDSDIYPLVILESDNRTTDDVKNILKKIENGLYRAEVDEDCKAILKFKGKNGKISDISISININDSYVNTDESNYVPGSKMIANTERIKTLLLKGIITKRPLNNNYFLFSNTTDKVLAEIPFNRQYTYIIDVTKDFEYIINIYEPVEETTKNHILDYEDMTPIQTYKLENSNNILEIFYNMDATISQFIYVLDTNKVIDVINDRELTFYIENGSIAPIIVMGNGEPLNLTGAYRIKNNKYIFTNYNREIFDSMRVIQTSENISRKEDIVTLYGVNKQDILNEDKLYEIDKNDSIDLFTNSYTKYKEHELTIDKDVNKIIFEDYKKYDYIVVDYLIDESYSINKIARTNTYNVSISTKKENIDIIFENKPYKRFEDGKKLIELHAEDKQYIVLSNSEREETK